MIDTKLLDSSIWVDFFFNGNHKKIIEGEESLLISALSLFEIKKKLTLGKLREEHIFKSLEFLKRRSIIIPVNADLAEKAVEISVKEKVPMADSIIYVTALEHECKVMTLDNHFRKLEMAEVL